MPFDIFSVLPALAARLIGDRLQLGASRKVIARVEVGDTLDGPRHLIGGGFALKRNPDPTSGLQRQLRWDRTTVSLTVTVVSTSEQAVYVQDVIVTTPDGEGDSRVVLTAPWPTADEPLSRGQPVERLFNLGWDDLLQLREPFVVSVHLTSGDVFTGTHEGFSWFEPPDREPAPGG